MAQLDAGTGRGDAEYLRRLQWLLLPAAFFNGFDSELRALLLPQLQRAFHVSLAATGVIGVPIGLGQLAAVVLVRRADRVGRRPLLLVSLVGYALFTGLTAAAHSIAAFVACQFGAQLFIGTEYALAVIVIAEEFAPESRGRALGRLLFAVPLGGVATAVLLGLGLQHSALGWRAFYLVGVLPALLLALARRLLRETHAYRAAEAAGATRAPARAVLVPPFRRRLVALGALNVLIKIPTAAAAGWWTYYAERERHLSTGVVAFDLAVAYGIGTLGYYACGRAIDHFGRRPVVTVFLSIGCASAAALFLLPGEAATFVLLLLAVFFGLGVGPALSALSAESFPTALRGEASAIVGNVFALSGELAGPALVGGIAAAISGGHRVGNAVALLTVLALPALAVLWRFVPETRGAQLEQADPLAPIPAGGAGGGGGGARHTGVVPHLGGACPRRQDRR